MIRTIKTLLSLMIVSLSVLLVQLKGYGENVETDPMAVQVTVKSTEENAENFIKEQSESINFEIDKVTEEMNQKMIEIGSIEDKKERFIAYKSIIDEYSHIIDQPETIYDYFTEEELDLLFRVVQAEIGDEYTFEQKCNVASVIFNRLEYVRFPGTLSEILTPDQFQPIADGRYKKVEVSEDTILSCEYAFVMEDTTNGSLFFDSNDTLKYEFVMNDGAHNFYKLKGEKYNE